MSKHTAGPWLAMRGSESTGREVADWAVTVDDGHIWICTGPTWDSEFQDESYANAHLIAAAPELLEALCLAHDHLALTHESFDGEPDEVLKQIRSAIAKARGES